MIEVKINGVVKWQVNEYTFVDPQMGLRSISLTVAHPSDNATVPSFIGAYVEYEGERYDIVNSKPTAEKGIDSINYKYNLVFSGQEAELQKRKIRNLATVGVDTFISQGTSFSLYADINQFKQLLENNLKYYFGNKWTINLGSTTSESVMVSVNNMFIWDLLLKTFEYYGLRWNITVNTINIGYTPDVIQHVFDYGYSGGLVKITRTAQSEPTINRLVGVGGSRNVPINYFTNRYSDFPVDPNPISGDVNIKNIMPKVFRDSVIAGTLPYTDYVEDAALVAADGVKEDALEPNEEIYPSIAGVEVTGLGRIDQIIAASVPTANTPDDAGYSPTFDIWVKDIGFDLADNQYTATQDAKISFTSGMLAGYEFVILPEKKLVGGEWKMVRKVEVDTSKSYGGVSSKYKITLINSSEDFTATGRMLPNSVIKAMAGDSFVIYDIIMPQTYVELAELRVQNWLNEQLLVKKVEKPTYAIEPTDTFFEENIAHESDGKTIREKLKSGNKLTVNNTKVTDGAQELHINNITIQYGGLLPKYSFVVTDKVSVQGSAIARLTNEIQKTDNSVQDTDKKIVKLQQYSDRQWKEIQETITLLGAAIDGFSTGINPITVQTMQLLVGNESLQFRFVNSKTTPVAVSHAFNWDDVLKNFTTTSGIIQHMTLGITEISSNHPVSAYKFWDIASYSNNTLVAEKPYYLYAKCSRTTSGAVFLLSDVPIGMYDDANYYYFLTGILNSENSDGGRSFVSLYGFTEILPGRITTDKIVSSDGLTYFDLLNGVIGGKIRFASTGGGETSLAEWADGTSQDIQDAQAAANDAALAAQQAIDDAAANVGLINTEVGKLQAQIDGEVSNWFYPYSPTLANYPASDWTTNTIKDRHIGDTFTNTQQAPATDAGKSWRFVKNGTVYSWTQIADSDAVLALQKAAQAQSTADGKSTTYLIQPTSYKFGDMWVLASDQTVNGTSYKAGEILTATQDSTTYNQAHWVKKVRYTDDSAVNNMNIGSRNFWLNSALISKSATTAAWSIASRDLTGLIENGSQVTIQFDINVDAPFNIVLYAANQSPIVFGTTLLTNLASFNLVSGKQTIKHTFNFDSSKPFINIYKNSSELRTATVTFLMLGLGNKVTWSEAQEDIDLRINTAKQEALTAAGNAQTSANTANTAVGNLNTYVDGSFKDGVIEASEAKAIEKYINIVNTEKSNLEATYNTLYTNTYLEGTPKSDLLNAKVTYFGAVDTLLNSINTAISDGKTTIAEKQAVDTNYSSYKTALASLQTAIENANKAIQTKLDTLSTDRVNNLQVGIDNVLKSSNTPIVSVGSYLMGGYTSENFINGQTYTLMFFSTANVRAFISQNVQIGNAVAGLNRMVFTYSGQALADQMINFYNTSSGYATQQTVSWACLYKGDVKAPNEWTESFKVVTTDIATNKLTAERAQLAADGYMRARYVRDWASGNSVNFNNQWNEIRIINKAGVNLAQGKSVESNGTISTPANVTDNVTATGSAIINSTKTDNWVKIDLGSIIYDIDYVQIFHYYLDGRTYYGTKTEISTDGVNWTPVFDSAKSGTYKETAAGNIISFRPNEVLAKVLKGAAVTDTFKTTINGGLISTVMILLRELNSIIETAGISGIQDDGYLPAYWSGGTYAEALAFGELMRAVDRGDNPIASATLNAKMSSIVMLHNGHAKVGELIVKSNGQIIVLDKATGKIKFVINSQDIPSVADLMSGTTFGSTVNNSAAFTSTTTTLPLTINVEKNNSNITFAATNAYLSATIYDVAATVQLRIDLLRNGSYYASITRLLAGYDFQNVSVNNINMLFTGCPTGVYSIRMNIVVVGNASSPLGEISASSFSWSFTQSGVRYFQLGLNGLMAYYSDNHFHYTETGGLDVRGATNTPGILASGTINADRTRVANTAWGAKNNTSNPTGSAGTYTVPLLNLSHANYQVHITPYTASRLWYISAKTSTSFTVVITNTSGTGIDTKFDYTVIGNNY